MVTKYQGDVQPMAPEVLANYRANYFPMVNNTTQRAGIDASGMNIRFWSPAAFLEAMATVPQVAEADQAIEAAFDYLQRQAPQAARDAWWSTWTAYKVARQTSTKATDAWRAFAGAHNELVKKAGLAPLVEQPPTVPSTTPGTTPAPAPQPAASSDKIPDWALYVGIGAGVLVIGGIAYKLTR